MYKNKVTYSYIGMILCMKVIIKIYMYMYRIYPSFRINCASEDNCFGEGSS